MQINWIQVESPWRVAIATRSLKRGRRWDPHKNCDLLHLNYHISPSFFIKQFPFFPRCVWCVWGDVMRASVSLHSLTSLTRDVCWARQILHPITGSFLLFGVSIVEIWVRCDFTRRLEKEKKSCFPFSLWMRVGEESRTLNTKNPYRMSRARSVGGRANTSEIDRNEIIKKHK